MSAEEDTELRDLVAQCLETNGVLNKIRVSCLCRLHIAFSDSIKWVFYVVGPAPDCSLAFTDEISSVDKQQLLPHDSWYFQSVLATITMIHIK